MRNPCVALGFVAFGALGVVTSDWRVLNVRTFLLTAPYSVAPIVVRFSSMDRDLVLAPSSSALLVPGVLLPFLKEGRVALEALDFRPTTVVGAARRGRRGVGRAAVQLFEQPQVGDVAVVIAVPDRDYIQREEDDVERRWIESGYAYRVRGTIRPTWRGAFGMVCRELLPQAGLVARRTA